MPPDDTTGEAGATVAPPMGPTLFLVDGYALIYRAFFALISRPLTTARGENTSAAWGVVNFLQRLRTSHRPAYLAWVHDSGTSFRHEVFPEYKATRQKLTEELQSDFDQGLTRIAQLLDAYRVPIVSVPGYEADDVIGTLTRLAVERNVPVVVVSGDKDFQQLVRPGVWLLNPGRGGPAGVEEQWVGVPNADQRLGVPPEHVTDFLALVGDASDNVPGVPGIGEKTARELVRAHGGLETIIAAAPRITGKRPREALLAFPDRARLSKRLVTIHDDVPVTLDLEALRTRPSDVTRLRQLFLELEFTSLLRELDREVDVSATPAPDQADRQYSVVADVAAVQGLVQRARAAGHIAIDTETVPEDGRPRQVDPLRSRLVGISIALAPREAYYLPLAHREWRPLQAELLGELPEIAAVRNGAETGDDSEGEPADAGDTPKSATASGRVRRSAAKSRARNADETSVAARLLAGGTRPPDNLPPLTSAELAPLRELLTDPAVGKTAQNAKFDLLVLRRAGAGLAGLEFDTMLASYVLDPGRRAHGLDLLALEFLDYRMMSYEDLCGRGRQQLPFDVVPVEAARDYSCEDADIALRLKSVFETQLAAHDLATLFREIEIPLVEVLADMEQVGVSIDVDWFRSLKARFQREREEVEQEILAAAGENFNINSNQQLRTILFEKLRLPIRKRTSTGPSTDASVLQQLADEGHVLPALLMEYRELAKLESTYLDTLPELIHPDDGRLHTSFNQTIAATGRLSSSDPNLQNIPIRRELGRDIRRGFVAQPGWQLLVADYSQIELRLLAHLSRDPAFVEAFASGGDIHRQTAAVIFGIPVEAVTGDMRARAKTINFATIYGQGATALARQLRISVAEAKAFIATYFERFKGVRDYLDSQIAFARENGYVETIFRRRRYVPELRDRNFSTRAFGERVATNAPIQGSAADLIKIAMIRIHNALRTGGHASRMILQVHDELVFEVDPGELAGVAELVRREMEQVTTLSVPLVVDVGVGPNWLDAKA
ncbi:MAG TPA: DNA polymerase I [Gemmatimonadaceae bacterium]|nr:DNA polymerase I [Gemmatimonadaceae bacterium]